jgi:transaldolase
MRLFADAADISEIRELAATGLLNGVTTNPSLIAKTGRPFNDVIREICDAVDGPVSAEVTATDFEGWWRRERSSPPSPRTWRSRCPLPGTGSGPAEP